MYYGSQRGTAVTRDKREASVIHFIPNSTAVSQQFTASWTHSIKTPVLLSHPYQYRHTHTLLCGAY